MSGNICAATNSPSPCSKATTISSTNPAPHGTSSPTIPNASPQSHPELGRRSILEAVGMSSRVIVIVHQQHQHVAQMALPEYDDMIVNRRDLGTHTVLMNSET